MGIHLGATIISDFTVFSEFLNPNCGSYSTISKTITVFLDCLHTKIKSSTPLANPYTQEAKHQPIFAQL